ncbi:hypothetical protein [Georgenia thermotolerans]|uniref:hypothetical protein n=1 Tax=Georgenia thermotolerans TaxID=527326 RepID=UPI00126464F6|nr:hypothetical protein [Georgenia thermotolerans]
MSDGTTTPAPEAPAQDAAEAQQKTPPAEDSTDWKAEARKWETRAKENKAAAERLAELEQAQMTEAEKAAARVKAAEERAAQLEAANIRKDVAIQYGLTADDVALLEGVTDADAMRRLAERLARQAREDAAPRSPRPNPAQWEGDSPAEDKDAVARAFFGI